MNLLHRHLLFLAVVAWSIAVCAATVEIRTPWMDGFLQTPPRALDPSFGGAYSLALGDVDGDGDPDLVAGSASKGLSWWENRDGAFGVMTNRGIVSPSSHVRSVRLFDLEQDGDVDVTAVSWMDGAVYIWRNDAGNGSSWSRIEVNSDLTWCSSVEPGDVDGDGLPDLVATTEFDGFVVWFRNPGTNGSAWLRGEIGDVSRAHACDIADMDGDGDSDVVVADSWGNAVLWFERGVGAAPQWTQRTVASISGPGFVRIEDMDQDGRADVVCAANSSPGVVWWRNTGNPTNWVRNIISTNRCSGEIRIALMDGDANLDVAATFPETGEVLWWAGLDSSGTAWSERPLLGRYDGVRGIAVKDATGDGSNDFILASDSLGIGLHERISEHRVVLPAGTSMVAVIDGRRTEVVLRQSSVVGVSSQRVALSWLRIGDTTNSGVGVRTDQFTATNRVDIDFVWTQQVWFAVSADGPGVVHGTSGWFNIGSFLSVTAMPNENADFVGWSGDTGNAPTNAHSLHLSMDQARYITAWFAWRHFTLTVSNAHTVTVLGTPALLFTEQSLPVATGAVHLADIDRDGDVDVVGRTVATGLAWWPRQAGGFGTAEVIHAAAATPAAIHGFDANNDGWTDLVVAGASITVWLNGGGTSAWQQALVTPLTGMTVGNPADMDGDGAMDVVAANSATIRWFKNPGAGGGIWRTNPVGAIMFSKPSQIVVADVNHDGRQDVLAATEAPPSSTLFASIGATQWLGQSLSPSSQSLDASDVDGDGDLDIVLGGYGISSTHTQASWLENSTSTGGVWMSRGFGSAANSLDFARMVSRDFDGDGDLDIIGTESPSPFISSVDQLRGIVFLRNEARGAAWTRIVYPLNNAVARILQAADVDGDVSLDVVATTQASSTGTATNRWLRNGFFVDELFAPPSDSRTVRARRNIIVTSHDAVRAMGGTQVVLDGWTWLGNSPTSGLTRVPRGLSLLTNSVLSFEWGTNYWVDLSATGGGVVSPSSGWRRADSLLPISAAPTQYCDFVRWSGTTQGLVDVSSPTQMLSVIRPLSLQAVFAEQTVGPAVPVWWLASHGITENLATAVFDDTDGDGASTWQEYYADTAPANPASRLRLADVAETANGTILTWSGGVHARQVVETRSMADEGEVWFPILTNHPPTDVEESVLLPPSEGESRLFRIRSHR